MLIFSIVSTFVLSCTLALLWHKVRKARNESSKLWKICSVARFCHDRVTSIYNDDNLTIEEKYKKIYC